MTRQEILETAMKQAEPYLIQHDIGQAFAAYTIELKQHEETENHPAITMGLQFLLNGLIADVKSMRKYLEGFN